MKNSFKKYWDILLIVGLPVAACAFLWSKSDLPPYGTPLNELSDQYWGILMDIARQWKTGDFSFWTRSIGGGFCLYTSGFYPLWAPLNIAAKFLSYDQFYILKIIEPYFIGLFTMALFLRHGLRLSYPLAAFGALAYSGFVFTRHVGIIYYPFFLWACACFPLFLYFYTQLFNKHIYWRSAVLGALMALVFLGGGGGQYAQMILWGSILLVTDALFFVKGKSFLRRMILAFVSCAIFVFFSFTIVGGQILPMAAYTMTESSRTLGEYPINNFPFFGNDYKGTTSISNILWNSIWLDGDNGVRAFWALMIFAFGKLIVDWKMFRQWCERNKALVNVGVSILIFFIIPPVAELVSYASPFFARLFSPLRMVTFGYCGFMIDMILVLFIVVVLDLKTFSDAGVPQQKPLQKQWKRTVLIVFMVLAQGYLFLPLLMSELFPRLQNNNFSIPYLERYLTTLLLLTLIFPLPKFKFWQTLVVFLGLGFLGNMLVQNSYDWGEKGKKTAVAEYHFDTPEHEFYRNMKGRYFMPFIDDKARPHRYGSMGHNYELLYEVDGLGGFLNIPPKRLTNFINAYHNQIYWTKNTPAYKFSWKVTPELFATYFPVEFATIEKGARLPWPGFSKKLDGEEYDVWGRDEPVEPVRFAKEVRVVPYRELVESFDRPYEGVIYMTEEDAARYYPAALEQDPHLKEAAYHNFTRKRSDYWTFDVESSDEVFVLLPEMYQNGWRLKIDGQMSSLFPADYIFMGLFLEKGKHHVELEFRPVLWEAGWLLTFMGTGIFLFVLYANLKKRNKKQ